MIKKLFIQNYALIKKLEMAPSARFNTITGETGAGKSIMLGALGLLLGKRADTRVLFDNNEKCVIEGVFDVSAHYFERIFGEHDLDYFPEAIIRREISPAGKSRAFINDTPVTLEVMKSIGDYLVDIHSQRDTYLLGSSSYQLHIVDGYADNGALLAGYQQKFKSFKEKESAFLRLKNESEALNKEADYNHFLFEELDKAKLNDGEQENLEEELKILEHAEEIRSKLFECLEILDNNEFAVNPNLQTVSKNLERISSFSEHFNSLKERMESCLIELKDLTGEIQNEEQKTEVDPQRLEEIQERLGLLYRLYQKHQVNTERELITIRDELDEKVQKFQNIDEELRNADAELEHAQKELQQASALLSDSRKAVFDAFRHEMEEVLKNLAIPNAILEFEHQPSKASFMGADDVHIRFSANIGVPPDDLKNVASGGEFSRVMFAIKYILAGKTSLPTIVFDEIDTGLSGEVAIKLVNMMDEMAQRHQVITITHLPQIAAKGDDHYFVYKDHMEGRSVSSIRKLLGKEQEEMLAKMIGGDNPSPAAFESARDLLRK